MGHETPNAPLNCLPVSGRASWTAVWLIAGDMGRRSLLEWE